MFCFTLGEGGPSLFNVVHIWIILFRIAFVGGEIVHLDVMVSVTCSSVVIVTVTKRTRFLDIDLLKFCISFDVIDVARILISSQLHRE